MLIVKKSYNIICMKGSIKIIKYYISKI